MSDVSRLKELNQRAEHLLANGPIEPVQNGVSTITLTKRKMFKPYHLAITQELHGREGQMVTSYQWRDEKNQVVIEGISGTNFVAAVLGLSIGEVKRVYEDVHYDQIENNLSALEQAQEATNG